jgi:competence protein ComEC
MHLVLVLALFVKTLEAGLVRWEWAAARVDVGRLSALIGVPIAWIYAEFAGAGGSTLRAAWMATITLLARAFGRRSDAARAFAISIGVMALDDPLVAHDLSFALSAAATGGLLAFAGPMSHVLVGVDARDGARSRRGHSWPVRLATRLSQAVATTVAASAPCVPIVARFAPTVPLGGVFANLIAVPIGECAALPLCLIHAALGAWPAAERGCTLVASGSLVVVRAIARGASIPALTANIPQPTSWQLAAIAVALAILLLRHPWRRMILFCAAAAMLGLELWARRAGAPRGVLRATFLDVGQGDAAIIDLPDGEALVIDGGGLVGSPIDIGLRVLAPELRARRRSRIAVAALTHPHPDHFGGFATGLTGLKVDAFWDTGQGEYEGIGGAYATLLASMRERGVPIWRPDRLCGTWEIGGARIAVLAPCPSFSSDRGPNDNSLVLRVSFGKRSLLLVGDSEGEEEGTLLATVRSQLRADVLKVGHHGSRTSSSSSFLSAVAPKEAIVSVGCRNRFGHPSRTTLDALSAVGARLWRTDRDGAIVVTTDGESLEVRRSGRSIPSAE